MKFGTILVAIGIFTATATKAAERPYDDRLAAVGIQVRSAASDLTVADWTAFMSLIDRLHGFLAPDIWPQSILLDLKRESDNVSYVATRLHVAHRLIDDQGQLVSERASQAATAHEFGHAVFDTLMGPAMAEYGQYLQSNRQYWDQYEALEQILKEVESLKVKIEAGTHDALEAERLATLEGLSEQGLKRLKSIVSERPRAVSATYDRLLPYNELFADVVAIAFANDPEALLPAVGNPQFRDFNAAPEIAGWSETDPYGIFAPVRGLIWHTYLAPKAPVKIELKELLRGMAKAIATENSRNGAHYLSDAANVAEANQGLWSAIQHNVHN